MGKKIFLSILPVLFVGVLAAAAFAQDMRLDAFISNALENNPKIKAAYLEWQEVEHMVGPAGSLSNPMVEYAIMGEHVETRVGPQEGKYGFSQKVPFPGKLGLKKRAMAKEAAMAKERYAAVRREVIKDIKFAYYDLYWVDSAIQVSEEEKSVLENLESVTSKKYETQSAPYQDVVKAQVELSKLLDRLFMLRQNRKSLVARLNSLLNRKRDTEIERIRDVSKPSFSYSLEELRDMAHKDRQELTAANLDIERADYEKSLARLNYLPDFNLGFEYITIGSGDTTMPNDGQDAWMGMVGVELPIWFGKLSEELKAKKAALEASRKNYSDTKNMVDFEVEDIFFKIKAYADIILLYETALMPQTVQAFEAAQTGYEAGRTDFLNWLDAERILLSTRLAYYKAETDYLKSLAYLERVVGVGLKNETLI